MAEGFYLKPETMSNVIPRAQCRIMQLEVCIIPVNTMPKRETMGSRLRRARLEAGLSLSQLKERIEKVHRAEIGETTIREIEVDRPPNPGIKTVELISLGLGLSPLEVIALALDDPPPETTLGFSQSRFAALWKAYSRVAPPKRVLIDELLEMLIERINKA